MPSVYIPEDQPDQPIESTTDAETTPLVFPPLTHQCLENCSFSSWYPAFRSLSIKSKIIPLSDDFVSYLNADKVFIPGQRFDFLILLGIMKLVFLFSAKLMLVSCWIDF